MLLTTEIYLEYYEIISIRGKASSLHSFEKLILESDNILLVDVTYNWNLIHADPDDNKFIDCAVAGAADYLVTNDNHFDVVKRISFPVVNIISPDEFLKILGKQAL